MEIIFVVDGKDPPRIERFFEEAQEGNGGLSDCMQHFTGVGREHKDSLIGEHVLHRDVPLPIGTTSGRKSAIPSHQESIPLL